VADDSKTWAATVRAYRGDGPVTYEEVGGINPAGGPVALCVGGTNRLTGNLAPDFWGASCDADEIEVGRLFRKSVVPSAILAKAHMPDLAKVIAAFNVESIESRPDEFVRQRVSRRKVEFESLDFNERFLATVPEGYDPVALRELFSPGFLEWVTTIDREVDFGINDRQFWFTWRLRERSAEELKLALANAGELFTRIHREMENEDIHHYPPGPWNAGLEPFPPD
jgi:hypothetical protein